MVKWRKLVLSYARMMIVIERLRCCSPPMLLELSSVWKTTMVDLKDGSALLETQWPVFGGV